MAKAPTKPSVRRKPARPGKLAQGRWLGDFGKLSAAEKRLVGCCARGAVWTPTGWDGKRPKAASATNSIRGEIIRFLTLGGDAGHPVHEEGVMAGGAWIGGVLNLHQCCAPVRLDLRQCRFAEQPSFLKAQLPELALSGCLVPGLTADRLTVTGGIFLDDGFAAEGEVRLLSASIGGNLACSGGTFSNAGGNALSADGIKVTGGLFLREARIDGGANLTAAHIGTLIDDADCWKAGGHLFDGLHYDRIVGPTDAKSRIAWLKRQHPDHLTAEDWQPQPWVKLIKILREMGHPAEAAEIAIAQQKHMYEERIIGIRKANPAYEDRRYRLKVDNAWVGGMNWLSRRFHCVYGRLAGYGHRPADIIIYMIGVWLACTLCFESGRQYGYFGPSNPVIHTNAAFAACGAPGDTARDGKPVNAWHTSACPTPPEYSTLFTPLYSLDLILPLVDLQQDNVWSPMVVNRKGDQLIAGHVLRALLWFEILFGWFASLMFVAIVSRLVEKD